jgi:hypothetical protein
METKKTESQIEKFTKEVESLSKERLTGKEGYLIFSYGELGEGRQENGYTIKGSLNNIAECLYSCMMKNPTLANVVMAAAGAVAQQRMMQMMPSEKPATPEESIKKPSKRKSKKINS